jgi:hypothetical protein
MTPVLSTTGLVLHDLGLATAFGGSLFGKIALNPAVRTLASLEERGKVVNTAWNGFNVLNVLSLTTATLTWLVGRSKLTGREIDETTQTLVTAKDALLGASVVLGAANVAAETFLTRQGIDGAVPMESGNAPSLSTPPKAASALRAINLMGIVNLACLAGVIGITAFLNMKAGTSSKWSALTRFLP